MARCTNCGKEKSFFEGGKGLCAECFAVEMVEGRIKTPEEMKADAEARRVADATKTAEIDGIMLTTEAYPQGLTITRRIEVVTAECAFGMNIFKDLFAGVRDIVGGRSEAVQKTMRDSRRVALYELKKEAHAVGANAVIGVDLDYVELSAAGSMVLLVASGTAVKIED
jgi:uncharacterized protein YbjQ (UPF0145 family)